MEKVKNKAAVIGNCTYVSVYVGSTYTSKNEHRQIPGKTDKFNVALT